MTEQERKKFSAYTDGETFARIRDFDSVSEMWERCLRDYAADTAVTDGPEGAVRGYTFAETEAACADFRGVIAGEGRTGILVPNSFAFVRAFLAAVTLGQTAVILPVQLPADAIGGCCLKYGLSRLVYAPELEEKLAVAKKIAPQTALISAESVSGKNVPAARVSGEAPCVMMFTGGTTGKSKGALLSNAAVMQGTVNGCYGLSDVFGQRYLLSLPLSHVFGLIRNLLTSLYTGSNLFICRNNKDLFRDAAIFRPTVLVTVPALAELALTLSKKFGRNMLGADMKYIICGAAAVPPYLIAEYHKLGIDLFPGYGLTESANLVSGNPESLRKPDSVGLIYPNLEHKVVDGELWLRGRNMLLSYVGEDIPAYTEDGWFRTGDLVRFDEEGFLYITGRIKEIIVLSNGENVSPAEVESHFAALPLVQDCELYEDVTETGAHILVLEVLPRMTELSRLPEAERGAALSSQIAGVNAALPAYCRYSRLVIRTEDFPRTPSMKILRHGAVKA